MKKIRWYAVILALALLVTSVVAPQSGLAQPTNTDYGGLAAPLHSASGGPIRSAFAISQLNKNQAHPAVAYNSQQEQYLVVWHNEWGGNKDIYGQRVSREGALIGPWFLISPTGGQYHSPDVAYNSQHAEYLVVWQDDTFKSIYGRRLSATGQLKGGGPINITPGILMDPTAYHAQPAVAYAYTADKYLVVYRYASSTGSAIGSQPLAYDGTFATGTSYVEIAPFSPPGVPAMPDVSYNRTRNEFLVVWQRRNVGPPAEHDIYGRRVRMLPSPGTLGAAFQIFNYGNDETAPAVAAIPYPSGTGEYLVTCEVVVAGQRDIDGQRVTGTGGLTGFRLSLAAGTVDRRNPAVAGNENARQYLVAWTEPSTIFVFEAINAATVSTQGDVGDTAFVGGTFGDEAAVAAGPLGDFLTAFKDTPLLASDADIYGQLWGNRLYLPVTKR